MTGAEQARQALSQLQNPEKAAFLPRFFKTGPGEYGEGDQFLGVTVPQVRQVAKRYSHLSLAELKTLLTSPWHEERLLALIILTQVYKKADTVLQRDIYMFYLAHTAHINNWDLVDTSAEHIVGAWLQDKSEKTEVLMRLAVSPLLWERRIAMLATFHYIKQGSAHEALLIAETLLHDRHDLIHKAVGWMLREIGKRIDYTILTTFLDAHAATMPRTALRYAIERLNPDMRQHYMRLRIQGL